jgi:RHS repeat-associated protein
LSDGRWNYTWNAENQLIKQESLATAPAGSKRRLEYKYDYRGRRIWKKETNLDASAVISERKFYYDGWNCIAEFDVATSTVVQNYVWGRDITGRRAGAGGIGGLVAIRDSTGTRHFPTYDGMGNVAGLVKATDGAISGSYEYEPFGQTIRITGPMGTVNPFRHATKYTENTGGLSDYGHRRYNPATGRWANRDPIGELGGLNCYGFVRNNPLKHWGFLGLDEGYYDDWDYYNDYKNYQAEMDYQDGGARQAMQQMQDALAETVEPIADSIGANDFLEGMMNDDPLQAGWGLFNLASLLPGAEGKQAQNLEANCSRNANRPHQR